MRLFVYIDLLTPDTFLGGEEKRFSKNGVLQQML